MILLEKQLKMWCCPSLYMYNWKKKNTFMIKAFLGNSLSVQWLRFHLPMQGVWVWSLVRELRLHMPPGQKTKHKSNRSNKFDKNFIVTNAIKTFKMVHIKKNLKKKRKKHFWCLFFWYRLKARKAMRCQWNIWKFSFSYSAWVGLKETPK